jgi:hypothetical protein
MKMELIIMIMILKIIFPIILLSSLNKNIGDFIEIRKRQEIGVFKKVSIV